MSAAIEKLEGVESVKVSLKERAAEIKLKPGNKLTVEKVREAVRLSGYEPKDTHMQVAGKLVERGGKPAVEITGTEVVYPLTPAKDGPEIKADAIGKKVVIKGRLPEAPVSKPDELLSLEVVSLTIE